MARAIYEGIKISGLACAVPPNIEYIRDYADEFDVERFISTVGVEQRRVAMDQQCASDLCYVAAEQLITHKGYSKDSIDGIILVTESPDYAIPATAYVLHNRLGLTSDCFALDLNQGCSGFIFGINVAASMIKADLANRILLCCGEIQAHSYLFPEHDPASSMMFGDAGCAVILEKGDEVIRSLLKSDGKRYKVIISPGYHDRMGRDYDKFKQEDITFKMDGASVFEFAIKSEPEVVREYLDYYHETMDDYDYCVFHQANRFILNHVRRKLRIPKEKMPICIDRYGNTGSVSIPLTIADLRDQLRKGKNRFITSGFGAGLSWGVAGFSMESRDILPIIETEDYYRDAYRG